MIEMIYFYAPIFIGLFLIWIGFQTEDIPGFIWLKYVLLIFAVILIIVGLSTPITGVDWLPWVKNKKNRDREKSLWFLRWLEPLETDYSYLKNTEDYLSEKEIWEEYNNRRKYYVSSIEEINRKHGTNYWDIINEYYSTPNKTNGCMPNEIKKIVSEMEKENVSLLYRPEIDYMPFGGPVWADNPSNKRLIKKNGYYLITEENISNIRMDHLKYYDLEKVKKDYYKIST